MSVRVSVTRIRLKYRDGMVLHTATSGAVPDLDELRLVVIDQGTVTALGASRVNIAYLSGIDAESLVGVCVQAVQAVDWQNGWNDILRSLDVRFPELPAPARMLIEMAAADGAARSAGLPLSAWLGGATAPKVSTNQTLFYSDDQTMLQRAEKYVARGYTDLKLRVGAGELDDDIRRLKLLRQRFGDRIELAVDVNGTWPAMAAQQYSERLQPFALRYIEQPIAPTDWSCLMQLSESSLIPLMLDESLNSLAAAERLADSATSMLAHLKLAKLGGLDRIMQAGRRLQAAGTGIMVGQMNEGVVSTLAAAHAAVALQAEYRELYGADGLAYDPAGELTYADGCLALPAGPGLGLTTHEIAGSVLWEQTI